MYFVLWNDDWYYNEGVGWQEFETLKEAVQFINERFELMPACKTAKDIDDYVLIEGQKLKLVEKKHITRVEVED